MKTTPSTSLSLALTLTLILAMSPSPTSASLPSLPTHHRIHTIHSPSSPTSLSSLSSPSSSSSRSPSLSALQLDFDSDIVTLLPKGGAATTTTLASSPPPLPLPLPSSSSSLTSNLITTVYFLIWYGLNIHYNIINKHFLNCLNLPLTIGVIQLLIGSIYYTSTILFRLRPKPTLPCPVHKPGIDLFIASLSHSIGQIMTMLSLSAGAVSFTHIVKALEPFFSAIVAFLLTGHLMNVYVYLSLLPVVGGVALACLSELSYSHTAFLSAMCSNAAFAFRAVKSKDVMNQVLVDEKRGKGMKNMSPSSLYGIVTIVATFIGIPIALAFESTKVRSAVASYLAKDGQNTSALLKGLLLTGLFHYLNNEVMYLALSRVHPVTLAVGNTLKRVFIIVSSVIVFGTKMTTNSIVGSGIGIGGVLFYSVVKMHFEKIEAKRSKN